MRFDYWSTLTCLAAVGFAAIALGSIGGCLLFEGQVLAQTNTGGATSDTRTGSTTGPGGTGSFGSMNAPSDRTINGSPNASNGPRSGTNQDAQGRSLDTSIPSAGAASGPDAGTSRASDNPPIRVDRGPRPAGNGVGTDAAVGLCTEAPRKAASCP